MAKLNAKFLLALTKDYRFFGVTSLKVCIGAKWPIRVKLISSYCSVKGLRIFLFPVPLDGMLVLHMVTSAIINSLVSIYAPG